MTQDVSPPSPAIEALAAALGISAEQASDPWWRLNNLYHIVTDEGEKIPFRMNVQQAAFMRALWYLNIILKARQHGFTTLIALMMLDQCVFLDNVKAGVITLTLPDAFDLFRTKILGPWESLPDAVRAANPPIAQNKSELLFANGSKISVDTNFRGGTLQYLHISEFGPIAQKRPDIAAEIIRGAFNAVAPGQYIFVESTAAGKGGSYHEYVQLAQQTRDARRRLTRMDWRLHFFPWWMKPTNRLPEDEWPLIQIPSNFRRYFDGVEQEMKVTLDPGQRAWYYVKWKQPNVGDDGMWQEHPSTEAEPFQVAAAGSYFAAEMALLRQRGQIGRFQAIPGVPVNTFWDWGLNDSTFILFHQRVHGWDRFSLSYENNGEALAHYAQFMRDTGYPVFGRHFFPHDMGHDRPGLTQILTLEEMANQVGIKPSTIIPRVDDKRISIAKARELLPTCCFDAEDASGVIDCLDNYSKEWNDLQGVWRDKPKGSPWNHGADAFQTYAMAFDLLRGLGPTEKPKTAKTRRTKPAGSWRSR